MSLTLCGVFFKQKRVGHAGTLDPAAAGVLPVALGRAARLVEYMEGADKSYRAEIAFGYATDTGDVYGDVIASAAHLSSLRRRSCTPVLPALVGHITADAARVFSDQDWRSACL